MNSNIQYIHYRSISNDPRGGATVAIQPDDASQTALISIAKCNSSDVFNKKIGRNIAAGRLRAFTEGRDSSISNVRVVVVNDPTQLKSIVNAELFDEMSNQNLW